MQSLELHHRRRQEAILNFEDGTAGRLMNADVVSVRPDVSLAVVLRWLNSKEIAVGALNDLAWALVIAAVAYAWFGSMDIALTLGAVMILNLLIAALAGVVTSTVAEPGRNRPRVV